MKKNMKGTTVVEVVVSFAIVALAVGIGLMGVGIGGSFINRGADLKRIRSNAQVEMSCADDDEDVTVVVAPGTTLTVKAEQYVITDDSGNEVFSEYRPKP